jgi:hypothetical protein
MVPQAPAYAGAREALSTEKGGGMTAWQKQIRDRRAAEDADVDLFGRWWEGLDLTLAKSAVRPIDIAAAQTVIEKYEWLGTMPAVILHCYGIFFDGALGGAAIYSPEYAENLGVWDKYGYTGKIICLTRGACVHWSPAGTGSRLIRQSMKLLPRRYEVVTATCDAEADEVGTIYQASGFCYVGKMHPGSRVSITTSAGIISERQAKRLHNSRGERALKELGVAGVKRHERKTRYFAFRAAARIHRKAIAHLIKTYPKRDPSSGRACPTGASLVQPKGIAPT